MSTYSLADSPAKRRAAGLSLPGYFASVAIHTLLLVVAGVLSFAVAPNPSWLFRCCDQEDATLPEPLVTLGESTPEPTFDNYMPSIEIPIEYGVTDCGPKFDPSENVTPSRLVPIVPLLREAPRMRTRGELVPGGPDYTEFVIAAGLKWLLRHQLEDGGWSFDHQLAPECQGKCDEPGEMAESRTAATALALLAYLGAGQTHREGTYKETVQRGLKFLIARQRRTERGTCRMDEPEGYLHSHSLATLALSECYRMSKDPKVGEPAQLALDYLVAAQDKTTGGWPAMREAGPVAAAGWHMMALRSGQLAHLEIKDGKNVLARASRFLDASEADRGNGRAASLLSAEQTAAASRYLCRAHLDWPSLTPREHRGIEFLSVTGLSRTELEYDYFATQILRHHNGAEWKPWWNNLRDWLTQDQAKSSHVEGTKSGHAEGSWNFEVDRLNTPGGRLYSTAMAIMLLEVYYRHQPIYGRDAVEKGWNGL